MKTKEITLFNLINNNVRIELNGSNFNVVVTPYFMSYMENHPEDLETIAGILRDKILTEVRL